MPCGVEIVEIRRVDSETFCVVAVLTSKPTQANAIKTKTFSAVAVAIDKQVHDSSSCEPCATCLGCIHSLEVREP
jgi:hypothetical protein